MHQAGSLLAAGRSCRAEPGCSDFCQDQSALPLSWDQKGDHKHDGKLTASSGKKSPPAELRLPVFPGSFTSSV